MKIKKCLSVGQKEITGIRLKFHDRLETKKDNIKFIES